MALYNHPVAVLKSQCTYRCVVLPDPGDYDIRVGGLPTSQCTYRCVVLPDWGCLLFSVGIALVSMHLQVRGAP